MKARHTSVWMNAELAEQVKNRTTSMLGPSAVMTRDLRRYYRAVDSLVQELGLYQPELLLIADSIHGTFDLEPEHIWHEVADNIALNKQHLKFGLTDDMAAGLVQRLQTMPLHHLIALQDAVERALNLMETMSTHAAFVRVGLIQPRQQIQE